MNGMRDGIMSAAQGIIDAAVAAARAAIDAVRNALGISSPSWVFYEIGELMAQGLIDGIRDSTEDVREAAEEMLDVAGTLSGLGSAAAQRWEEELDPLEAELDMLDARIAEMVGLREAGVWSRARDAELRRTQERRNEVAREYERIQERLLRLQEAQADLSFLQQQVKLLDTIAEHGLDAEEILGGMTLGVDASVDEIVFAMTRALEEIIGTTEEELGIASPSRVFAGIGQQMMEGLASGIRGAVRLPALATAGAMTSISHTNNLTMNVHTRATKSSVIQDFAVMRALV
jgi:hypothetical protein